MPPPVTGPSRCLASSPAPTAPPTRSAPHGTLQRRTRAPGQQAGREGEQRLRPGAREAERGYSGPTCPGRREPRYLVPRPGLPVARGGEDEPPARHLTPTPAAERGQAPQSSSGPQRLGRLPGPPHCGQRRAEDAEPGTEGARRRRLPSPGVVLEEAGGVGEKAPPEGPPLRRLPGRRHDGPSATGTGNIAAPSDPRED